MVLSVKTELLCVVVVGFGIFILFLLFTMWSSQILGRWFVVSGLLSRVFIDFSLDES